VWPLAARAQQQGKIPRIGIIVGLRDLGYLEGQNIAFEYRTADGVPERLAEAATDLVRRPVDIIATYGTPSSIAAKAATTTIPIVMIGVGDVLRTGLVQSFAHPGGNITGNTILGVEVQSKRLQLFKDVVPALSRVAFPWNPDNASNRLAVEEVRVAANCPSSPCRTCRANRPTRPALASPRQSPGTGAILQRSLDRLR
jgi:putative tryptophan/tyrosine transport system substrate-binding protein